VHGAGHLLRTAARPQGVAGRPEERHVAARPTFVGTMPMKCGSCRGRARLTAANRRRSRRLKCRAGDLAREDLELVAQDEDLEVLRAVAF
jgi:hypothetical protein